MKQGRNLFVAATAAEAKAAAMKVTDLTPAQFAIYDRGRRDMLNAILDLNPEVAAKVALWAEKEPDPEGRIPFNVALWVTEVAAQLGIKSAEEMAEEMAEDAREGGAS